MSSKAERRRLKKERGQQPLPELAVVPRRKARGKQRMKQIQHEAVEDIPALMVRCRHAGAAPTRAAIRDAKAPWRGCSAGLAMSSVVTDDTDRSDLWTAIQHIRRARVALDAAIGAPKRHAQCLRLLAPLDALEADAASPALDDRSDEEKQRQAVSGMMAVEGWLGHTDTRSASICKRTVIDDERCSDADALVRALRCVVDGIKGHKIRYRGLDK